jgi:hypothetical protein
MTQLVAFGGETVGMTVQQAVDYFGDDFLIHTLSYTTPSGTPSGLVAIENADSQGVINGQTTYFGYVSAARVLADCVLSNFYTYNRKTKAFTYLAGPYPWLKKDATMDDLPSKVTIHTYETRPLSNSVFAYLEYVDGKVKPTIFSNKAPLTTRTLQNPSGATITPTFVLMLTNGGPDQTAGGYSLRSMSQSTAQLASIEEYTVEQLGDVEKEGYIDITTKTIFINPTKKAIVRLEVTGARMGDIMGKTWAIEGAINLETGEWSKFFEQL